VTSPAFRTRPADPFVLSLDELAVLWAGAASGSPIGAEAMTGADRRAQMLGIPGLTLMETAGTAVAAVARALADHAETLGRGPILVLAGPGNNGGDGFVAARHLAEHGLEVAVALCATDPRPGTADAGRNWERLATLERVTRMHAPTARDLALLGRGIEKASLVVDALLGTGVRGILRDPIRAAVDLANRARAEQVPVLSVDTPTALDLTSGEVSDPVVRADATITFHRPKLGLLTKSGRALAGRVLVAPIGIPPEADRG
jgi:NAD(P)H-hydrate epimerase